MSKRTASRKQRDPSRCSYSKMIPRPDLGYAEILSRDRDGNVVKGRTEIVDQDGNVLMKEVEYIDENGNWAKEQKPVVDSEKIVTVWIDEGQLVDYVHLVSVTFPDVSNARGRFAFNCRIHGMKHRQMKTENPGSLTFALYPTCERQLKNFIVGLDRPYYILTEGKRSERYSTSQHRLPSSKYDAKGDVQENKTSLYRNGQRIRKAVDRTDE